MDTLETLDKAREFSPEIAVWVDDMTRQGVSPAFILQVLTRAVALAKAEREWKEIAS